MEKIRFVGDIHGKVKSLKTLVGTDYQTIQVGDFGIGFIKGNSENYFEPEDRMRFIRGNHDFPDGCKSDPNWIPDGSIEVINGKKIMFIGGATSIDKDWRIEGVSWWPDEELSYYAFDRIIQKYNAEKPDILIAHECPEFVSNYICDHRNKIKFEDYSLTRKALETMVLNHPPELYIHGHWHTDFDMNILGTRYICLNELSYIDIDTNDLMDGSIVKYYRF